MSTLPTFERDAVVALRCYREGWELIKGDYWLVFGATTIAMILGSVVPLGVLMGPMMCGINLVMLRRLRGEPVEVDHVFRGFEWFGPSLLVLLTTIGIVLASLIPVGVVTAAAALAGNAMSGEAGALILGVTVGLTGLLVAMSVGTFFVFAYPLFVERGMESGDALRLSTRAVLANFSGVMGIYGLSLLLSIAGACFFFVGAYLVMPLGFAAFAVAYRDVFGLAERPDYWRVAPPG